MPNKPEAGMSIDGGPAQVGVRHCACFTCEFRPAWGEWWILCRWGHLKPLLDVLPDNIPLRCPRCLEMLGANGTTKRSVHIDMRAWPFLLWATILWALAIIGLIVVIGSFWSADAADLPADPVRYARFEAQFTPGLHDVASDVASLSQHLYPNMTDAERWFIEREIVYLNKGGNTSKDITSIGGQRQLTVPVYQRSAKFFCGDVRNWHVAVQKGRKYGVHPALMIAVRSHENPKRSRDRYAYGVVIKRHTNLWTQGEWGAKIIDRISASQGWSSLSPTQANLYSLGAVYCVGRGPSRLSASGRARTSHWSRSVWAFYRRAQG